MNPLKDPLPKAPSMRMYCMYGVGSPAERSYHYQHVEDANVCSTLSKTGLHTHTVHSVSYLALFVKAQAWLSEPFCADVYSCGAAYKVTCLHDPPLAHVNGIARVFFHIATQDMSNGMILSLGKQALDSCSALSLRTCLMRTRRKQGAMKDGRTCTGRSIRKCMIQTLA